MQTPPTCLILKLVVVPLLEKLFQEAEEKKKEEKPLKNRQSKTNDSCACKRRGEGKKEGKMKKEKEEDGRRLVETEISSHMTRRRSQALVLRRPEGAAGVGVGGGVSWQKND